MAKQSSFDTEGAHHKAAGEKTPKVDFDRNREGTYGGRAEARDHKTPTPSDKNPKH